MPFTVSHVAFVIPFRDRLRLPLCGLAVGAMAPDLEYVVHGQPHRTISHSPFGIVTLDLALGMVLLIGATLAAPGLGSLIPARHHVLREHVSQWRAPMGSLPALARLAAAVVVGATSHVVIDGFTHAGSFPATEIPFLVSSTPIRGWTGAKLLQYGLSLIGIIVVARALLRELDELGVHGAVADTWSPAQRWVMTSATIATSLLVVHDHATRIGAATLRENLVLAFLLTARAMLIIAFVSGLVLHPSLRRT